MNPTYFQKSEDSDFLERIQRVVKKEQYDTKILETYHYHPNYKSSALRMWFIYFTIRNHLYTCAKSGIIHYVSYFPIIFAHIWSGVLQIS
ncbi:MAG: hypothetical protein LBD75_04455 [Candidatus Peribacteria bacterium]|nr:hypothetical protein [Candidatus Peribacteria bacterium]